MIVETMTNTEVYRELDKERDAVHRWWNAKLDEQRRRVLKSTRFPVCLWFEYTSARKNRYLFTTQIADKKMRHVLTGVFVLKRTNAGITIYETCLWYSRKFEKSVLTPHFWKRYAERARVEKTGIELIKHFVEHNPVGENSRNLKTVGRSVRYNGEDHLTVCISDGVMLGQKKDGIFIVRTFITYDMCTGLQQEFFEDKRKKIELIDSLWNLPEIYKMDPMSAFGQSTKQPND